MCSILFMEKGIGEDFLRMEGRKGGWERGEVCSHGPQSRSALTETNVLPVRPRGCQPDRQISFLTGAGIQAREKPRTGSLCIRVYLFVTVDPTTIGEDKTAREKGAQQEIYF